MKERSVFVYALSDPRTNEVGYIGATTDLSVRLASHMREMFKKGQGKRSKNVWIKDIMDSGNSPVIRTLEVCSIENWKEREFWWINEGRKLGWPLTNVRPGGNGSLEKSEETRRKIGEGNSGERHHQYGKSLSNETKRRISDALSGEKNGFYGKKHTEATRKRLAEASSGHVPWNKGNRMTKVGCDKCVTNPVSSRGLCDGCAARARRLGIIHNYPTRRERELQGQV